MTQNNCKPNNTYNLIMNINLCLVNVICMSFRQETLTKRAKKIDGDMHKKIKKGKELEAGLYRCLIEESITKKVAKKKSTANAIQNGECVCQQEIQTNFNDMIEEQAIATPSSLYVLESGCTPRSYTATP